ncbi:MAG: hypothetical protein CVV41_12250 [Candidatus Riflebacteria bacterium HGW-Riflebacteria-1]|jgi:hypothetical protein|nr:MAG: hypothetical protein CVV41_12250 [Candidatus Riflebacteria bacterium HGW-Riflebacteria-1]
MSVQSAALSFRDHSIVFWQRRICGLASLAKRLLCCFAAREGHGWPGAGEHQDRSEPTNAPFKPRTVNAVRGVESNQDAFASSLCSEMPAVADQLAVSPPCLIIARRCLTIFLCFIFLGAAPDLLAAMPSQASAANEEWQFFRINAQYRGTVKKGFQSLGCGIAWFKDLAPGKTQVIVHVSALHPEKRGQKYTFRVNMVLNCRPAAYSVDSEVYAQFTGVAGDRQQQIRQLVALWTYMRQVEKTGQVAGEFDAFGARLLLRDIQTRSGKTREIHCGWSGRRDFSGKFFFNQLAAQMLSLDKFRFKSGKLSVSLTKDTAESINRDFAHREPFATDVFK